jgi:hypothetical protein
MTRSRSGLGVSEGTEVRSNLGEGSGAQRSESPDPLAKPLDDNEDDESEDEGRRPLPKGKERSRRYEQEREPSRTVEPGQGFVDPAIFQRTMMQMMERLTDAVARQNEGPRQSATPFGSKPNEPKIKDPDTFHGARDKLNAFLTECSLVFRLQSSKFPDDVTKIYYAISLLRDAPLLAIQPHLADYPAPDFLEDYSKFKEYMRTNYGDPDEKGTARRKLRALAQRSSASAYFAEFQQYIAILGWKDDEPIVDKAIEGLKPYLKDELARHSERPATLVDLMRFIIPLDNRLYEREMEKKKDNKTTNFEQKETVKTERRQVSSGSGNTTTSSAKTETTYSRPTSGAAASRTTSSTSSYPSTNNGQVRGPLSDAEKARRRANGLCLFCGEAGHIVMECPAARAKEQKSRSSNAVRLLSSEGNEQAASQ